MKIRFLAFALVLVMMIPLVVSCKKGGNDEVTTPEETSDTTPVFEKVLLAENGNSEYKIIRSEYIDDSFYNKYVDFLKDIKDETGAYFRASDDFLRADMDKSAPLEIVFGKANRVESKQVYDSISYDGYAIKHVGNKIVIAAYQPKKMILALKDFFKECIEIEEDANGTKKVYFVKEIVVAGEEKPFFNADNQISDYKVIYSKDAEDAADSFVKLLKKYTGVVLEAFPDSTTVSDKEILIGDTNRDESKVNDKISKIGFLIKTVGTKVVIRSGSAGNILNAVNLVASKYMTVAPDLNFPATLNATHTSYEGTDNIELTEGADIRVMSFNILSEEWAAEAKDIDARIPGVVGGIRKVVRRAQRVSRRYV